MNRRILLLVLMAVACCSTCFASKGNLINLTAIHKYLCIITFSLKDVKPDEPIRIVIDGEVKEFMPEDFAKRLGFTVPTPAKGNAVPDGLSISPICPEYCTPCEVSK